MSDIAVKSYTQTIGPGDTATCPGVGDLLAFIDSNLTTFKLSFEGGQFTEGRAGFQFEPKGGFNGIRINNPSATTDLTVTYVVAQGEFRDNRATIAGAVDLSKGTNLVNGADVSVASGGTKTALSTEPTRREAIVQNRNTNGVTLRVGETGNTDGTHGLELGPGGSVTLETTAAIDVHNPGASPEEVSILEVRD